jgi:hypothetical protein
VCRAQRLQPPTCRRSNRSPAHHHHVTQSSHSINAIGPAPLWSGRKREHCSIMFATITHNPSLHKILSNTPRNHPAPPPTTSCGGCWYQEQSYSRSS